MCDFFFYSSLFEKLSTTYRTYRTSVNNLLFPSLQPLLHKQLCSQPRIHVQPLCSTSCTWKTSVLNNSCVEQLLCWTTVVLNNSCVEQLLCWTTLVLNSFCVEKLLFWKTLVLNNSCVEQPLCWTTPRLNNLCFEQPLCWTTPVCIRPPVHG